MAAAVILGGFMKNKLVFVDAETDGLYGSFLTVGLAAMDMEGNIIERAYYGIRRENLRVTDVWTRENVLPVLGDYEACENEDELLEKAWTFWMRYQQEAYAVADVVSPVEARLFMQCVQKNETMRKWQAPFPLLDLASMLMAAGYDPLIDRNRLLGRTAASEKHNALYDALTAAEIWRIIRNTGTSSIQ